MRIRKSELKAIIMEVLNEKEINKIRYKDYSKLKNGKQKKIDEIKELFGDRIEKGGNDHTLAMAIVDNMMGTSYNVDNYKETFDLLYKITK